MIKAKLIGEKLVLFGLSWNQTSKENLNSDLKLESDRRAQDFGLFRKYNSLDGNTLYQFALSDYEDSTGAYAAADILTSIEEDVVYIYELNKKQAWVCVIHNGEVVSGGDLIVSTEDFSDKLQNILEELDIDISKFKFYADSNAKAFADGVYEAEIEFSEVVEKTDPKSFERFKKVRVSFQKHVFTGIAVAVLAGIGYFALSPSDDVVDMTPPPVYNIEDMRKKLPDRKERSIGDLVSQKVGPSKSQLIEDAYQEELSWLNYDYNLNNDSMLLKEVLKFIKSQTIHAGGWVAKNYYYDISEPKYHEIVWTKKSYGTALTLKETLEKKGVYHLQFDDKGSRVSSFVILNDVSPAKPLNIKEIMATSKRDLFHFMHDLDVAHFSWFSEATPASERPIAIAGITNMAQAKKRQLTLKSRNFRITGSGLNEVEKLAGLLDQHDRFVIERISFDFNEEFNWIVYGVFYEKEVR